MVLFILVFLMRKLSKQTNGFSICPQLPLPASALHAVAVKVIKSQMTQVTRQSHSISQAAETSLVVALLGQVPATWPSASSGG